MAAGKSVVMTVLITGVILLIKSLALIFAILANCLAVSLNKIMRFLLRSKMRSRTVMSAGRILPVRILVVIILSIILGISTNQSSADIAEAVLHRLVHVSSLRNNACILAVTLSSIPVI